MRYCFNLDCEQPVNDEGNDFCVSCGSPLLLQGRYVASRVLGQGGFGKMFLGVDLLRESKTCAIKQLLSRDQSGATLPPHAKIIFRREAEQLKLLGENPQTPSFIDFMEEGFAQYLVLEYIEGVTLTSLVYQNGTVRVFDEEQLIDFLRQMLNLLQRLHKAGIVQRDITPDNIMLRNGAYVLIDSGRTQLLESGIPPQPTGNTSGASDLYSLGVTCLFLLTGKRPEDLHDPYAGKWLWRLFLGQTQVSDRLASVLDRLVASPSEKRYTTVQEVVEALHLPTPPRISTQANGVVEALHPPTPPQVNTPAARTVVVPSVSVTRRVRRYGAIALLFVFGLPVFMVNSMVVRNVWDQLHPQSGPAVSVTTPTSSPSSSPSPSPTSSPSPQPPRIEEGHIENSIYRYEGQLLEGIPHGRGVKMIKSDGARETGSFTHGLFVSGGRLLKDGTLEKGSFKDGLLDTITGERTYPNKDRESGVFQRGTFIKGEKVLADGTRLKGSFRDGKLNGVGSKILTTASDTTRHEGYFVDNVLSGRGKIFRNGNILEGDFRNGELNGKGKAIYSNGWVYEGEFKYGKLNGIGKISHKKVATWEGEFINSRLNGKGKVTADDGAYTYEGEFRNHELIEGKRTTSGGFVEEGEFDGLSLHGNGKKTSPNGEVVEGKFVNGLLNGKGKETYPDGKVREGQFKNGRLNGQGRIVETDGRTWEGEFESGLLRTGKMTTAEGQIWEGKFRWNKLNGKGKITFRGDSRYEDGTFVEGTFEDHVLVERGRMTFPNGRSIAVKGERYTPVNPWDALVHELHRRKN